MKEVVKEYASIICLCIALIVLGERVIAYYSKKSKDIVVEDENIYEKIANFCYRCIWPTLFLFLLAVLAKIYIDFS